MVVVGCGSRACLVLGGLLQRVGLGGVPVDAVQRGLFESLAALLAGGGE
jgi:hypothetical protein